MWSQTAVLVLPKLGFPKKRNQQKAACTWQAISFPALYTMIEEEMSIFLEVTVSAILSKKVNVYRCPIPSFFRDGAVSV
jgi:hypothetical protein